MRGKLRLALAAGAGFVSPGAARDVHDDFTLPISTNWFQCEREESFFGHANVDRRRSYRMTVAPRQPFFASMDTDGHAYCDLAVEPGEKAERAEIWERGCEFEDFGTEVWQSYAVYLDKATPPAAVRFVSGQWKQGWSPRRLCASPMIAGAIEAEMRDATMKDDKLDPSPMLSQRFDHGKFTITLEQQDQRPGQPAFDQCRAVLAMDSALDQLDVKAHGPGGAEVDYAVAMKRAGAAVDAPLLPDPAALANTCLRDLRIERYRALPSPFGAWVTMNYHVKVTADAGGLVEVWADGVPIARAFGRIGSPPQIYPHPAGTRPTQYFKFGPYRDREMPSRTIWLADYWKQHRAQDLPAAPPPFPP